MPNAKRVPPKLPLSTWVKAIVLLALATGLTSAVFLFALRAVEQYREQQLWIMAGLPLAGVAVVFLYKRYAPNANKGNSLYYDEYKNPTGSISFVMAPLIVLATLVTHLFGGSAGREGTAIQYGGTYADTLAKKLKLAKQHSRILLICGVSAGFSSLFGTPLAGTAFSIAIFRKGKIRKSALIPALISAYVAHAITLALQAPHTHYQPVHIATYLDPQLLWIPVVAVLCGLVGRLFTLSHSFFSALFNRLKNPYIRVACGGLLLLSLVYLIGNTKYIGLGIPTLLSAFEIPQQPVDFLWKIILTTLTLSVGFKGGEVTPLFFIGATFCSFLSTLIPLPLPLITAVGFVSVFSAVTRTPLACAIMAAELFGIPILPIALAATFISSYTLNLNRRHFTFKKIASL